VRFLKKRLQVNQLNTFICNRFVSAGARTHNLKNVDVDLPRDRFIVVTGLSGSGKSSLAFRHAVRRGPASLRRIAVSLRAPVPVDDGEAGRRQPSKVCRRRSRSSRRRLPTTPASTVGTVTEIYDYLRLPLRAPRGFPAARIT